MRAVFTTRCLGCGRRLHAPNEAALQWRVFRHAPNCNVLRRQPPLVPLELLP